jgi:hypothetical protein
MKRAACDTGPTSALEPAAARPKLDRILIDVGGTTFTSSVATLTGSSAYFQRILSDLWQTEESGTLFLDRDPEPFAVLLSYMRDGLLGLPENDLLLSKRVLLNAEFLGMDGLLTEVKAQAERNMRPADEQGGTDQELAAAFDATHGILMDAIRSGVLPARFHGRAPPSPPPTKPKIVQMLPPNGCVANLLIDDVNAWNAHPVVALVLIEDPEGNAMERYRVDAFVENPQERGNVLVSEFAESMGHCSWEIMPPASDGDLIIPLPKGLVEASYWNDQMDHSQGSFTDSVEFLTKMRDADGDSVLRACDLRFINGAWKFSPVDKMGNFRGVNMV